MAESISRIAPAWRYIGPTMTNDNDTPVPATQRANKDEPDAHGQAALLLAESILHALVETKTLTLEAALSVIETTCEVKVEVAEQTGESSGRMHESLALLKAISASFAVDSEFGAQSPPG